MKFEVEVDVPQAFIDRRTPKVEDHLVDRDGNKIEEPTTEDMEKAARKAEKSRDANIVQMLFNVAIANQFRHEGLKPPKVTAKKL